MKQEPNKRFLVGSEVRLLKPGMQGTVIAVDDEPGVTGEYWHTVHTAHWERREPGSMGADEYMEFSSFSRVASEQH